MVRSLTAINTLTHRISTLRYDLLAVSLILAGYAFALALMPAAHDFALFDDWAYVRVAEKVAAGQGFAPSEYAQATLVAQSAIGALFLMLFGGGFTALTASTMLMSIVAALTFYALLRRVGYGVCLSGLGVALLTLNPYFINMSYSFMTEIPFLALLLLSCLFLYEGLRSGGEAWFWLGGLFTALTFLTRQFGLAPALAALIYMAYSRTLTWRRAEAVVALPLLAVTGYYFWSSGFGTTYSGSVGREELRELLTHPGAWANRAARFLYLAAFVPGLLVPLQARVKRPLLAVGFSLLTAAGVFVLWRVKLGQMARGAEPPNELSYFWLQPLASGLALALVYCLGAGLTAWLAWGMAERAWPVLAGAARRVHEPRPSEFLYITGLLLFAGTYIVSAGFLDRYWLPVLPFIITAALAPFRGKPIVRLAPAMAVLALVGTFGALTHLDMYSLVGGQWQAGRDLLAKGVALNKIENGYSWDGYFMHDSPKQRWPVLDISIIGRVFPPKEMIDPEYVIGTSPLSGYGIIESRSVTQRRGGPANLPLYIMHRE